MATPVLNICPFEIDVCITRGDSTPMTFTMQDLLGVDIDVTGRTFLMSVNAEEEPVAPTTNEFQLTGSVATANVTFTPLVADTDLPPGDYFYDIQETDGAALRTVVKGKFTINQDITK